VRSLCLPHVCNHSNILCSLRILIWSSDIRQEHLWLRYGIWLFEAVSDAVFTQHSPTIRACSMSTPTLPRATQTILRPCSCHESVKCAIFSVLWTWGKTANIFSGHKTMANSVQMRGGTRQPTRAEVCFVQGAQSPSKNRAN
jgi:hypothetical protein